MNGGKGDHRLSYCGRQRHKCCFLDSSILKKIAWQLVTGTIMNTIGVPLRVLPQWYKIQFLKKKKKILRVYGICSLFIKAFNSLTVIHLISRLKVSECTMEHTHCWDVQEGEGQSSEGRSRWSTQNRRDPGGWASLYRRPRSNRENCCQVHLFPFFWWLIVALQVTWSLTGRTDLGTASWAMLSQLYFNYQLCFKGFSHIEISDFWSHTLVLRSLLE